MKYQFLKINTSNGQISKLIFDTESPEDKEYLNLFPEHGTEHSEENREEIEDRLREMEIEMSEGESDDIIFREQEVEELYKFIQDNFFTKQQEQQQEEEFVGEEEKNKRVREQLVDLVYDEYSYSYQGSQDIVDKSNINFFTYEDGTRGQIVYPSLKVDLFEVDEEGNVFNFSKFHVHVGRD